MEYCKRTYHASAIMAMPKFYLRKPGPLGKSEIIGNAPMGESKSVEPLGRLSGLPAVLVASARLKRKTVKTSKRKNMHA